MTETPEDPILAAITGIVPPLLNALDALGFVSRHFHPQQMSAVLSAIGEPEVPLKEAFERFRAIPWPEDLADFAAGVSEAAERTLRAFEGLRAITNDPNDVFKGYRALGEVPRALERLYPLTRMFQPVSRFFLEQDCRDDTALLEKIANADASRENVGVMHANNDRSEKGGFSLYVPEYYDETKKYPVIMAMHGGSGHGRSFLWSWLRDARARGAILISPTSVGDTWSLMGPDQDTANLARMLGFVSEEWNVDETKLLLTGMSDGGTFTYVSGLLESSPFTHLAPVSASFHPMLLQFVEESRLKDLPIYLTHGALDWMFPLQVAEEAQASLKAAGADVTYRLIDDLSHTYPREENARIMDWFLGSAAP